MITCNPSAKRCQRGAAMLEMALVIPVFMGLLLALVDFGMYFTTRSVLQSAAYNGAKTGCGGGSSAEVGTAVSNTVSTVVDPAKISIPSQGFLDSGTALQRYRVQLSCSGASLSVFTGALDMYPIATTGMAACPPPSP